jgi:hypothetical protein
MGQCVPGLGKPPPDYPTIRTPDGLTLSKNLGPPECRVRLEKGGDDLPGLGRWVARLDQHSVPRLPLITPMIAMADVGVHLALGGVESVVRLPALKFILASACTLTGMGFFTRQLLEWSRDKAKDKATDSLADKAADWLLRYII